MREDKNSALLADKLSHVDERDGAPKMVNVGNKQITSREATAQARLLFPKEVAEKLRETDYVTPKGAVFTVSRIAAVMGVKQTSNLIPLCHPLPLNGCDIEIYMEGDEAVIEVTASCAGRTGVEMEALTGASIAALTIYDMCKALSHDMIIKETKLIAKSGGKRDFNRQQ